MLARAVSLPRVVSSQLSFLLRSGKGFLRFFFREVPFLRWGSCSFRLKIPLAKVLSGGASLGFPLPACSSLVFGPGGPSLAFGIDPEGSFLLSLSISLHGERSLVHILRCGFAREECRTVRIAKTCGVDFPGD